MAEAEAEAEVKAKQCVLCNRVYDTEKEFSDHMFVESNAILENLQANYPNVVNILAHITDIKKQMKYLKAETAERKEQVVMMNHVKFSPRLIERQSYNLN